LEAVPFEEPEDPLAGPLVLCNAHRANGFDFPVFLKTLIFENAHNGRLMMPQATRLAR
jgi:hypothetical protein